MHVPFRMILTGQHQETMGLLIRQFGIKTAPVIIYDGKEVAGVGQMIFWFFICFFKIFIRSRDVFARNAAGVGYLLIHGDTASTLLGALVGRLFGLSIVHVEAGLCSKRIFDPFPEEIIRRVVAKMSDIAFCPGSWAVANLATSRSFVVNTGRNTLVDSLAIALESIKAGEGGRIDNYAVASVHRTENIFNKKRFSVILELIEEVSRQRHVVFVLHPSTQRILEKRRLMSRLRLNPNISLVARMGYFEFIGLVSRADFVITDGGGNQEELSYLGIPTLVMRTVTERSEGIGSTAVICCFERAVVNNFIASLDKFSGKAEGTSLPSPSRMIAVELKRRVDVNG
ncbi:UDP-N-acetylglucosamine 2-epimerase (non-hydrolysing) [Oryzomicrobium terrae]|uniref:UDP-N-acetylglucosamine 2-epimerase (Non-hydrolysing) n=2 Tax=Oryzomicrobium terrae TaxID=1735038 RepID=A0A5C1EAX5_9RHOO|nr:UDP-N-acetylglucosamine 2-epimerase (non-hydrolysing) [Oryzomicrobium terrae]